MGGEIRAVVRQRCSSRHGVHHVVVVGGRGVGGICSRGRFRGKVRKERTGGGVAVLMEQLLLLMVMVLMVEMLRGSDSSEGIGSGVGGRGLLERHLYLVGAIVGVGVNSTATAVVVTVTTRRVFQKLCSLRDLRTRRGLVVEANSSHILVTSHVTICNVRGFMCY